LRSLKGRSKWDPGKEKGQEGDKLLGRRKESANPCATGKKRVGVTSERREILSSEPPRGNFKTNWHYGEHRQFWRRGEKNSRPKGQKKKKKRIRSKKKGVNREGGYCVDLGQEAASSKKGGEKGVD